MSAAGTVLCVVLLVTSLPNLHLEVSVVVALQVVGDGVGMVVVVGVMVVVVAGVDVVVVVGMGMVMVGVVREVFVEAQLEATLMMMGV